ncbi:MAG: 2-amino-4-hydroxy-6-hydroxymethyldihydropteridine diphosphokinase [Succinivibrio sp.]
MRKILLSLGSNMGNSQDILSHALVDISALPGISNLKVSPTYITKPVGYIEQPDFFNLAASVETYLNPIAVLHAMQAIEQKYHRVRTIKNGPRTLDIDLIDAEGTVSDDPVLTLPHPRMHVRAFVLAPLKDLVPNYRVEGHGKTIIELFNDLSDTEKASVRLANGK